MNVGGQHERAKRLQALKDMVHDEYAHTGEPVPRADVIRRAMHEWGITEAKVREYLEVLLGNNVLREIPHDTSAGITGTYLIPYPPRA